MLCGDFNHSQTLQMGVYHFSGLFVLLCLGLGSALLTSLGEHVFYRLVLPRIRRGNKLQYWLHTSQVRKQDKVGRGSRQPRTPLKHLFVPLEDPPSPQYRSTRGATGEGRAGAQVSREPEGHRLSGRADRLHCLLLLCPSGPKDELPATDGAGRWRRVRRAVERERRVRFLLEPGEAGGDRPWLCSNGPGLQVELQELELRIEAARERLRSALLRRGELRALLGDGTRLRPLRLLHAAPAES